MKGSLRRRHSASSVQEEAGNQRSDPKKRKVVRGPNELAFRDLIDGILQEDDEAKFNAKLLTGIRKAWDHRSTEGFLYTPWNTISTKLCEVVNPGPHLTLEYSPQYPVLAPESKGGWSDLQVPVPGVRGPVKVRNV